MLPATGVGAVTLVPGTAADRRRIGRVRAAAELAPFVHYNWFWLDRALADSAIHFRLIRAGARRKLAGVVAFGPHEPVDLDPASRRPDLGEIFHIVIDRGSARRGIGAAAIGMAIAELRRSMPRLGAVRVAHHPRNNAAAHLYKRLGFAIIGEKVDAETGIHDALLELALT